MLIHLMTELHLPWSFILLIIMGVYYMPVTVLSAIRVWSCWMFEGNPVGWVLHLTKEATQLREGTHLSHTSSSKVVAPALPLRSKCLTENMHFDSFRTSVCQGQSNLHLGPTSALEIVAIPCFMFWETESGNFIIHYIVTGNQPLPLREK